MIFGLVRIKPSVPRSFSTKLPLISCNVNPGLNRHSLSMKVTLIDRFRVVCQWYVAVPMVPPDQPTWRGLESTFCSFSWSKQTASPPQEVHWSHYSFRIQIYNKLNSATFHPFLCSVQKKKHYYPLFSSISWDSVGIWHMYCLARPSFLNITDRLRFFNQTTISRSSSDLIPN